MPVGNPNLRLGSKGEDGTTDMHFGDSVKIYFGDADDGYIEWNGTNLIIDPGDVGILRVQGSARNSDFGAYSLASSITTALTFSSGGASETARFGGVDGAFFLGDVSNANMSKGITINQAGYDDEVFATKSTDVAHALTSGAGFAIETDTFVSWRKLSASNGGLRETIVAADSAAVPVKLTNLYGGTANTAKTISARGLYEVYVSEHNGSNALADITADGNIFAVRRRIASSDQTAFLVDEDGDFLYDGADGGAFDSYDDVELLRSFSLATSTPKDIVKTEFDSFLKYNEDHLVEIGVLGAPVAEGGLINGAQLNRVLVGAAWQQELKIRRLEEKLAALEAGPVRPELPGV